VLDSPGLETLNFAKFENGLCMITVVRFLPAPPGCDPVIHNSIYIVKDLDTESAQQLCSALGEHRRHCTFCVEMGVDCTCPPSFRAELLPQHGRRGETLDDFLQQTVAMTTCKTTGKIVMQLAEGVRLDLPVHAESQFSRDFERCVSVAQSCFREHVGRRRLPIFNGLSGRMFWHGSDSVLEETRKQKLIKDFSKDAGNLGWGLRLPEIESEDSPLLKESVESISVAGKGLAFYAPGHSELNSSSGAAKSHTFSLASKAIDTSSNGAPSNHHPVLPSSAVDPVECPSTARPAATATVCHLCDRVLNRPHDLKRHLKTVHGDNARQHKCRSCGAAFKLSHHLRTHMRDIHGKAQPYACGLCEFRAETRKDVKTHLFGEHNRTSGIAELIKIQ